MRALSVASIDDHSRRRTPIGYAFPYDDVRPDGQPDVSGAAHDGNPRRFTLTVGS